VKVKLTFFICQKNLAAIAARLHSALLSSVGAEFAGFILQTVFERQSLRSIR